MPGKRSDPAKIARERAAARRDLEQRTNVPQSEREYPSPIERIRRFVESNVERKRAAAERRQPRPRREGAEVTGTRRNNSPV